MEKTKVMLILLLMIPFVFAEQNVQIETQVTTTNGTVEISLVGGSSLSLSCVNNQSITQTLSKQINNSIILSETDMILKNISNNYLGLIGMFNTTQECQTTVETVRNQLDESVTKLQQCQDKPAPDCSQEINAAKGIFDQQQNQWEKEKAEARTNFWLWVIVAVGIGYITRYIQTKFGYRDDIERMGKY